MTRKKRERDMILRNRRPTKQIRLDLILETKHREHEQIVHDLERALKAKKMREKKK